VFKKFGKSSRGILKYQKYLIEEINEHIASEKKFEQSYLKSEKRDNCLICQCKIIEIDFMRNGINYSFCSDCGHLNGHNELSESLMDQTYSEQTKNGIQYDKHYIQEVADFNLTVKNIYEPKADFLRNALQQDLSTSPVEDLKIMDFGTGSGHMVKAFQNVGFNRVIGIDPMETTINFGRDVMGLSNLIRVPVSESKDFLAKTDSKIVTMICTLPHVADHNEILETMRANPNINYTFQKLPFFSLSAILDIIHPNMNSRVISGTHTHIYTEKSLGFIEKRYGLIRIGEWRFGADILDLYRNLQIGIRNNHFSENFANEVDKFLLPLIDELQLVLDQNNYSSEIHVLWKFIR